MELQSPLIYDIVKDRDSEGYRLFLNEIESIQRREFKLKANYENIDLDRFHSFTVLTDSGKLVAFSGLQRAGPWSERVARLSSRFYISPDFQTRGMLAYKFAPNYRSSYHTGSKHLNPYQIEVARRLGLDGVFISREYPLKRKSLVAIAERCAYYDRSGSTYELLPVLMNVSATNSRSNRPAHWQNIIAVKFNENFKIGLPELSLEEWKKTFQTEAYKS